MSSIYIYNIYMLDVLDTNIVHMRVCVPVCVCVCACVYHVFIGWWDGDGSNMGE